MDARAALHTAVESLFTEEGMSSSLQAAALFFREAGAQAEEGRCWLKLGTKGLSAPLARAATAETDTRTPSEAEVKEVEAAVTSIQRGLEVSAPTVWRHAP